MAPSDLQFLPMLEQPVISLGEPLLVAYTLTNVGEQLLDFDLGEAEREWISSRILDSEGLAVPVQVSRRSPTGSTVSLANPDRNPRQLLPNGGSVEGWFVGSEGVVIPSAGQYSLEITAHLTYWVGDQEFELQQVNTLPFTVDARNATRLSELAVAMQAELLNDIDPPSFERRMALTDALFSMPEADVLNSWRALATDSSTERLVHIRMCYQLARIGSFAAADVLSVMTWGTGAPGSVGQYVFAANTLSELTQANDQALTDHIHQLFLEHEGQVPEEVLAGQPVAGELGPQVAPPPPPMDAP